MANEVSKIYNDIAELLNIAKARAYHSVILLWLKLIGKSDSVLLKKTGRKF